MNTAYTKKIFSRWIIVWLLPLPLFAVEPILDLKLPREAIGEAIPPCQVCDCCGISQSLCLINTELRCIACEIAALSSELETLVESIIETIDSVSDVILSSIAACCSLLDSEIVSVSDVLGSKIDSCCSLLDAEIASVGESIIDKLDCGFGVSFGQGDIPFTITKPGTYILCEDIEALAPSPSLITIANDDIIVNLNGHRVDGNGISGASGLINIVGVNNIVVERGIMADSAGNDLVVRNAMNVMINDLKLIGTNNPAPRILVDGTETVTLTALEIETGLDPAITMINMAQNTLIRESIVSGDSAVPGLITSTSTSGTIFDAVWFSGITTGTTAGIVSVNDTNISIRNCIAELLQTGYRLVFANDFEITDTLARSIVPGGFGGFIITGPSCQNGFIHNCTVIGANSVGYSITNGVANVVLRDCCAINTNGGFTGDTVQNITWDQCIVEKSAAFGFSAATGQQLLWQGCRAHKCIATGFSGTNLLASELSDCTAQAVGGGITLTTCTAMNLNGCQLSQSTTTGIHLDGSPNCVIEDTIVNGTSTLGYFMANGSTGVTLENCRALNTAIGFSADASDSVVFKNCMADEANVGAGFSVTSGHQVVHDQSIALNCIGNGFEGINAQDMLYTNCSASSATNGFFASATDRLLYCECAAQSNTVGQFIAADSTRTIIRECCIGNNIQDDLLNFATDTDIICIDDLFCAIGPIIPLHQSDFTAPVTLATPNHYKLCENVTASTTITIASSDVILDLGEFFLDGVSILVNDNLSNVTIRNGQIRDVPFFIDIGTGTENLIIENLVLNGITASLTQFGIRIASGPANGVILRDLTFYNSAPTSILLNGAAVTNVTLENIQHFGANQALTGTLGTDATINLFDCSQVLLKDILIADPTAGIDAILLVQSASITLDNVQITTSQTLSGTPAGVHVDSCTNVATSESEVSGAGFAYGFFVQNTTAASKSLSYTGCKAVGMNNTGFLLSQDTDSFGNTNVTITDCSASGTVAGAGIMVGLSSNVIIADSSANINFGDGIATSSVTDCVMENIIVMSNCGNGIDAINTSQLALDNVMCINNILCGFLGSVVDNLSIENSVSEKNGAEGFHVLGANGGNIPGDPENTVGQSVSIVKTCFAFDNGSDGFYFTNVGGVRISDCVANYNFATGLHLDTGSWNAFVGDSTALSNGEVGFITWDRSLGAASLYNNRFYFCYASQNSNRSLYSPFSALSDYATANIPGIAIFPPIGAAFASDQLMLPDPLALVPKVFCAYF